MHLVGFYYKNISWCTVLWMSNFIVMFLISFLSSRNSLQISMVNQLAQDDGHSAHTNLSHSKPAALSDPTSMTVTLHNKKDCVFISHLSLLNPLNAELNPIFYLLALLAHHFLHVSRISVKSLTLRLLMSYIYGAPILDVSRSHTTTQHSR